jgi:phosphoenolpyruvate carboxykinase (ATP)
MAPTQQTKRRLAVCREMFANRDAAIAWNRIKRLGPRVVSGGRMTTSERQHVTNPLVSHGIRNPGRVHWTLNAAHLYEHSVQRGEAEIAEHGPLVASTGKFTGRTPRDKYIVDEPSSREHIWWDGNKSITPEQFDRLHQLVIDHTDGNELYVQDCLVGADERYQLKVRIITEKAWHNLFVRNMFIRKPARSVHDGEPDFTVIDVPTCFADADSIGIRSEQFIALSFEKKLVLIGGTEYGGEMKKSIFSVMHYELPLQNVFSMHCSANIGEDGDTALFFGLSGTGKTTLSTDPNRKLIGDDEHGWSDQGIFNFEGGCYAKMINLSQESEPEIFQTTRMFGTVLENVVMDPITRELDLDDNSLTENTRGAYPLESLPNVAENSVGDHPTAVIFLTADAFGVLPPISILSPEQAMYHFLSGYTAKVAGTEVGLTEPQATFSTCFGAPFLAHRPTVYANLLRERLKSHGSRVYLVNTGWIGGPAGESDRVPIKFTRSMIDAALSKELREVSTTTDPVFGFEVPDECPGVPSDVLKPRDAWEDKDAYDRQAQKLARMFRENFEKFAHLTDEDLEQYGPRVS